MLVQFPASFDAQVPAEARDIPHFAKKVAPRALVVDDEPLVRWAIAETLRARGYDVDEAGDAGEAMRRLSEAAPRPDLVLLDLRLPDCHDLSLLETVRRLAPAATVIMMTAYGTPEVRARALGIGAACVLEKPFDLSAIGDLIARIPV